MPEGIEILVHFVFNGKNNIRSIEIVLVQTVVAFRLDFFIQHHTVFRVTSISESNKNEVGDCGLPETIEDRSDIAYRWFGDV